MGVVVKFIRGKFYVYVNFHGRRKSKAIGTRERAEQFAERVRTALDIHGLDALKMFEAAPKPKKVPTIAEYSATWLAEMEKTDLALSTRLSYRQQTRKHIVPALGAIALDKLAYPAVKAFAIEKAKTRARGSVRAMIATLRVMLAEAVRDGLIPVNPIAGLGRYYGAAKSLKEAADPFTIEELHRVEAKMAERFPDFYEFVLTLSRTGLRIGEAIALQWIDVDFETRTLFIRRNLPQHRKVGRTKTYASERKVDMSPELTSALRELRARRRKEYLARGENEIPEWVFCTRVGTPIHYADFLRRQWNPAQSLAKVRRRTPHDLRHTWASQKLAQGEDLAYVAAQLGHKSIRITLDVYTHWIPGKKRLSDDSLDRVTANNTQTADGNGDK